MRKVIHCLLLAFCCAVSLLAAAAQSAVLKAIFQNPQPTVVEAFPSAIAAVGTDRVLIGAAFDMSSLELDVGSAYLFNTNGTLLVTITNLDQSSWGYFGFAVAALGSDRLIIGAPGKDFGGSVTAGKVYL